MRLSRRSWLSIFSFPTLIKIPLVCLQRPPSKDPELLQPPEPKACCEPKLRSLIPFIPFLASEKLSGDVDSPIDDSWPQPVQDELHSRNAASLRDLHPEPGVGTRLAGSLAFFFFFTRGTDRQTNPQKPKGRKGRNKKPRPEVGSELTSHRLASEFEQIWSPKRHKIGKGEGDLQSPKPLTPLSDSYRRDPWLCTFIICQNPQRLTHHSSSCLPFLR